MRGDIGMREYNVHEVLAILQKYYITESLQMVARWIREGKIQGIRSDNRKEGYRVLEEELFEFIEEQKPGLPSIMEVYEDYIKKLRLEHSEEIKQTQSPEVTIDKKILNSKENPYEQETNGLRQQLNSLENTLIDLQQEKQIIKMNMNEIIELNNTLIQNNKALLEENKQLKDNILKTAEPDDSSKSSNNKTKSTLGEKNSHITFEDFKNISKDVVSKLDSKLENTITEKHLSTIYEQIFEDGLIKASLVTKDGTIKCPYTHKEYKQPKRIISSAIKYYFENLDEH